MRKFENVDIIAALGAIVELNTEHYKSDFKVDIKMFKDAAKNPDGENNRFLWLSRQSGTECYREREAYIQNTAVFQAWNHHAVILGKDMPNQNVIVNDRIHAFAVTVTGIEKGKVKGDLHELNYSDHIRELNETALPLHTVTVKFEDGTKLTLPHAEYDGKRESLSYRYGSVTDLKPNPQDAEALKTVLSQAREKRNKHARPAAFNIRISAPNQKSIKQKIETGKEEIKNRAAAPKRAANKSKNNGLGD